MISKTFEEISSNSPSFKATFCTLLLGKKPEKYALYVKHAKLLAHIENFISYHLENKTEEKVHAFVCFESSPEVRQVVTEYLVVRFGVFHKDNISRIRKEVEHCNKYGWNVVEKNGSAASKQYFKNINYHHSKRPNEKMRYGDALRTFKKSLYDIGNNYPISQTENNSMIVCMENDLPDNRDSLLPEFYTCKFSPTSPLYCNYQHTGESLVDTLLDTFEDNEPTCSAVNTFLIYSNTDQSKLYRDSLDTLEQCGYNIENYFVFYFKKRKLTTRNLKTILQQIQIRYTKDIFYFDREELDYIYGITPPLQKKEYIGYEEDANLYGIELQNILTGIPYAYNYRNILSLCLNNRCKEVFFNSILSDIPDYEMPESSEIFSCIKMYWRDKIIPAIQRFEPTEPIALVIDWKTPMEIQSEIKRVLNRKVTFYDSSALKEGKGGIKEKSIIVMRHIGFDEFYLLHPNSHEPYHIRSDQKLLEIIPLALFAPKVFSSENKRILFTNKVKKNRYRINCLGWTPQPLLSRKAAYNFDWDEVDESTDREHRIGRVKVISDNDREYIKIESTFVIYQDANGVNITRIGDICERDDIKALSFIDNVENHLGVLIENAQSKYAAVEDAYRKELEQTHSIEQNPSAEVWRLLLKRKAETEGIETVTLELGKLLERHEENHKRMIERWLDLSQTLILPRRNATWYTLFDYLGIAKSSPYRTVIRIKKINTRRDSSEKNKLIKQLLINLINPKTKNINYASLYNEIPDALDVLGINSDKDLAFIIKEILMHLNFVNIKNISIYE